MNVDEMLAQISSRMLTEWMAFEQQEPLGDRRRDIQAAVVASTIANTFTERKRKPFTVADFLLTFWDEDKANRQNVDKMSLTEQRLFLELLNKSFKGKDLRKK